MGYIKKNELGWNACGVYCGKCHKDTCEGCKDEFKLFQGFSEEIIERLKREFNEDKEGNERNGI